MKKSRRLFWLMIVFTILLGASTAIASPIEGSSSGVFINPVGPGNWMFGVGTSNFAWGNGEPYNSPPSSLNFTGQSISTNYDTLFSFGTLAYYNGTVQGGTLADSVELSVALSLTSPSGITESFTYDLSLINTANSTDPAASADYVVFPTTYPTASFSAGGIDYTLLFNGFGSTSSGGFTVLNEFHVLEGQGASTELIGKITQSQPVVPEPISSTLFLIGGATLGFRRLRKQVS